MTLDLTPPPLAQLHHVEALAHVGEYVWAICALAPYTHVAPSTKTITTFHHFHPLVEVDLTHFIHDFNPKMDLVLDKETFIYVLMHSPLLSSNGPSIWCMNFSDIVLSLMTLLVALIFFLKYVNTLLMVMFLHQYHAYLLQHDYWIEENKLKAFNPSWLER